MIGSITTITSLDQPGLGPYRTLRRPLSHREQGIFVAEGGLVVQRFLEGEVEAVSILLTPEWLDHLRSLLDQRPERIAVLIADKQLLEGIVGIECHQGVMAVGKVPPPVNIETLLKRTSGPYLLIAADHLTSAENTGVLVRNCAAFGVTGLIAGRDSADPWLRRSVRNSMGTIFKVPIVYSPNLVETLRLLRDFGTRIFAAHPREGSRPIFEADFRQSCCIVLGHEGNGVSDEVLAECDQAVEIPMASGIDSLNVTCAGSAIMCEAVRQRRYFPSEKGEWRRVKGEG